MELVSVRIEESPQTAGRVRLVGEVAYDDRPGTEPYWFEVDEAHAGSLSLSGNAWVTTLLPAAVTIGQNLRINAPVDPLLISRIPRIMEKWREWYRERYPQLRPVSVEAPRETAPPAPTDGRTGVFFSGGIDSFYTALGQGDAGHPERGAFPRIDTLLWVGGFDLPLGSPREEFRRLQSRLASVAESLGVDFLSVLTNLRTTRYRGVAWGQVGHGCALAGVALALERRFAAMYISATHESGPVKPWGSHPETDPLLSTRSTRFLHDGLGVPRSEKTEAISRSDVALRELHVCFRSGSADNCGRCRKCLLALLTLDVFGALPRCRAFSVRPDLELVRRMYVRSPAYYRLYRDVERLARKAGRQDIASAIRACRIRYHLLKPFVNAAERIEDKRGLWRVARVVRRTFLEGSPK
jgi:hypothetical protein